MRRCPAASAAVFAVVRCRTQLAKPWQRTSCYFLVFLHVLIFRVGSGFWIPNGDGAGAFDTEGSPPMPICVRFDVQLHIDHLGERLNNPDGLPGLYDQ
eukprot:1450528-Pleurochrysis_carterae.AAC.2